MKSVLFAVLLATIASAQAADTDMDNVCATRPYVGVCPDDDSTGAGIQPAIEPQVPPAEPDCSTHPYVGVCDAGADG